MTHTAVLTYEHDRRDDRAALNDDVLDQVTLHLPTDLGPMSPEYFKFYPELLGVAGTGIPEEWGQRGRF